MNQASPNRWIPATFILLAALVISYGVRFFIVQPLPHSWVLLLIHALPLLAFVPFLRQSQPRPFIWLCFMITLFFCETVVTAFGWPHPLGITGTVQSILIGALFITAMMAARTMKGPRPKRQR